MNSKTRDFALLCFVLVVAVTLRVTNLYTLPRWDWDEGVNMNIAWNLVQGKAQMFCISYPFFPHPPLFFMILGSMLWVFGNSLMVLRALVVVYGLCTTVLLYFLGKELFDSRVGLLASFLYAVYPAAIYWGRQGFANNQLAFFSVLGFYFLVRFLNAKRQRYLYLAALSVSLCAVTELTGFAFVVSFWIVLWMYSRKDFWKGFFVSLVLPAVYFLVVVFFMREAFFYDAGHYGTLDTGGTKLRGSSVLWSLAGVGLFFVLYRTGYLGFIVRKNLDGIGQVFNLKNTKQLKTDFMLLICALNLLLAFTLASPLTEENLFDGLDYFWLGILGFIFVSARERNLLFIFFIPVFWSIMQVGRTDHMLIPLYPYFAFGLALLVRWSYTCLKKFICIRGIACYALAAILLCPFALALYQDVSTFVLARNFHTESLDTVMELTTYVNRNSNPDDVVLVPSHFPRFLKPQAAILTDGITKEGKTIAYFPENMPQERFVFNCSYKNAKYVITGKNAVEGLRNNSKLAEIGNEIDKWPVEYRINDTYIYRNPEK